MQLSPQTFKRVAFVAFTALPASFAFMACAVHSADEWPTARAIRIVIPSPAGGPSDIVFRPLAAAMQARLGQAVIIDNKSGANGNIGAAEVARAAPDGYTWLWSTDTVLTVNPHVYKNTGFKPGDLASLNYAARFSQTLVCNPALGFKKLGDMVQAAQNRPLSYASGGAGSPGHMVMEMLFASAKVKMTHIPYKGPAPAMQDLIGGQVDCGFLAGPTVLPSINAGRLTALASSGIVRTPLLPNVPTVAESGYPGFDGTFWLVLAAPKNIPPAIRQRFLAAMQEAIKAPGQQERVADIGIEMVGTTPEQAQARTEALSRHWGAIASRIQLAVD